MIRIYPNKIKKWSTIVENHKIGVETIVKNEIEKFEYIDNKYKLLKEVKNSVPVLIAKFDDKDKKFLEEFIGAKIIHIGKKVSIEFRNESENIQKLAIGKLKDIFQIYYDSIIKVNEFKNIRINDLMDLFIADDYRVKLLNEVTNVNLKGSRTETLKSRRNILEKYFNNTESPLKLSYFDSTFIEQYNEGDKCLSNKSRFKKIFKFNKEYIQKIEKLIHLNKILKNIFNYECFQSDGIKIKIDNNDEKWDRHKLISMLNISVCPYCNRQYISNYIDNKMEKKTTADLDHFYSQNNYPFLALSLYNFIPSCQICNSRFKLQKDFRFEEHVYPYEESFEDNAWFETGFIKKCGSDEYDMDFLFGISNVFDIDIKIKNQIEERLKNKIKNSIKTFKLKEVYQSHIDYVRALLLKSIIYNESKITELYTEYPGMFKGREEVVQMIVSNYISDEELGKRPLAKLTKDICEEFGLA